MIFIIETFKTSPKILYAVNKPQVSNCVAEYQHNANTEHSTSSESLELCFSGSKH